MATTPTNLPVPSESARDLKVNAGKIDEFVTSFALKYKDRFGGDHYTIEGLRQLAQQAIAAFGWVPMDSFQDGATLTLPNQVLRWKLPDGDGDYYRWDGAFPKTVPTASTPASTGGVGAGAWLSVGDAVLRTELSSDAEGNGDSLIAVRQPYSETVTRTQHALNADYVNVKDWGAKGDGITDDTAAIDAACIALTGSNFITNFRRLYFPHGTYIYNGAGIALPNGTSLIGEDLFTIIDASKNTNSGYLITLTGFKSYVDTLCLKGNPDNKTLIALSSYYNTEGGGCRNMIIEDFTNGIDIDKSWYTLFHNVRFRTSSSSVVLTGSHIRIGFNYPNEEVNNIEFSSIWMGEKQKHSVSVYSRTQVLNWNSCSFETLGEARIKFYTTSIQNTFQLNACYIEGDAPTNGIYLVEGQNIIQYIQCNNCMYRLGSSSGSLGKNITINDNGGWSNSPNVSLMTNNCMVWSDNYRYFSGGFSDGPDFGRTGLWDGASTQSASIYMTPRPLDIIDWNSLIPEVINSKSHPDTKAIQVFKAFIPAGSGTPRMMKLSLKISSKRVANNSDLYNEAWEIFITLPEASTPGSGVLASRVFENGTSGMGTGTGVVTVVSNGYDSATDAIAYTISHSTTVSSNSLYIMSGAYIEGGISTKTRRWKIQRI